MNWSFEHISTPREIPISEAEKQFEEQARKYQNDAARYFAGVFENVKREMENKKAPFGIDDLVLIDGVYQTK